MELTQLSSGLVLPGPWKPEPAPVPTHARVTPKVSETTGFSEDGSLTLCPSAAKKFNEVMLWSLYPHGASFLEKFSEFKDILWEEQMVDFEQYC